MKTNIGKVVIVLAVIGAGVYFWMHQRSGPAASLLQPVREVMPHRGAIQTVISTTGTILPKNRLEIKPPVSGRVESVLAKEGEAVKAGQIVAWMSSTERAALLDNARGQGEEALKYWEDAYKPIPLLAPIDGEVIVATTQPGQAVTTGDAVIVLSDHLIARAQVDETDIGKIKEGQIATVTLDAYPDTRISAAVEHIYHESETVNNVTIYKVDLFPEEVPAFFRSGMNANIDFVDQGKPDALLVPTESIQQEQGRSYVLVSRGAQEPVKRFIKTGMSDEKNTEVLSGVDEQDALILKPRKFVIPDSDIGTNPFMPNRRR